MASAATEARSRPYRAIPGPGGRWLIGDILAYESDRLAWLSGTQREYGDVVRLDPGTIMVHHPDAVHELLAQTNRTVVLDNALLAGRAGTKTLLAALPDWITVRRDTLRGLHRNLISVHLRRICGALRADFASHASQTADVFTVAQRLCGHATADFCLGSDGPTGDVVAGIERLFWISLELSQRREARRRWARRPTTRKAIAINNELLALLTARVARRRARPRPAAPGDLLDALLTGHEDAADRHLASVLRITMVASHGIPGAALAWTLLRLHEHGQVRAAIRAEVSSLPSDPLDPPSAGTGTGQILLPADAMPYTTAVIKEVLRLHPPAWLIVRKTIKPVTLAGYQIPPGTEIGICPYLIHRDPRWWPDAATFDPGRWTGTDQAPRNPHAYIPFGSGPRYCVGGHLGMAQLVLLAAEAASRYNLTMPPVSQVPESCRSLLLPGGLRGSWTPATSE